MSKKNQLIFNTDWLGLSLRLPEDVRKAPPEAVWNEYTATNVWNKRRVMWTKEGEKILTLLSQPRSEKLIDVRAGLVEIENAWLYKPGGEERVLDYLIKAAQFEILGMSRLDLCVDFCPTRKQADIVEGLASGKYYVQGKINGSLFWSSSTSQWLNPYWRGRRIPHCISWGHKTSSIRWKLYYKTKELVEAAGDRCFDKPYIVDKWQERGLDISNVWRLEVSIHNCNQQCYNGMRLSYDVYKNYGAEIFMALYGQRFIVRRNEGHKDKSNDTIVEFLPLQHGDMGFRVAEPKSLAERSARITLLRHVVQSMEDEAVIIDDVTRENTLWYIRELVRRDNLHNYFKMMTGEWIEEYIENQRVKAYSILASSQSS